MCAVDYTRSAYDQSELCERKEGIMDQQEGTVMSILGWEDGNGCLILCNG